MLSRIARLPPGHIRPRSIARARSAPGGMPAWAASLSVGQWYEISGSNLSAVEPGTNPGGNPANKIGAWTSVVVDEDNSVVYQVAGGGHTDYAGNEVDKLDLNVASPAWVALRTPSTASPGSYYADGRPSSRHHYYGLTWNKADNRIMLVNGARWDDGEVLPTVDSFNLAAGDYAAAGTHPNVSALMASQEIIAVCRDPGTDDVYVFGNYNAARWTRASNAWTALWSGQFAPFFSNNASAWDSTRGKVHLFVGPSSNWEYDPVGNTFTPRSLSGLAFPTPLGGVGMTYVPALDAFLVRYGSAGGAVYRINASTFEVTQPATTGGAGIPAMFAVDRVFNKFLYVPALQGCVYVPQHAANVWFLRLH